MPVPDWELIWNTLFDVAALSTRIERSNIDHDTARQKMRSAGRYIEVQHDIRIAPGEADYDTSADVEEGGEVTGIVEAVQAQRYLLVSYVFVSDRHAPADDLAQAEANRLVTASSYTAIKQLLVAAGLSLMEWSDIQDRPDLRVDQRRQSTATVTGTYLLSYCATPDDLKITLADPGWFDRIEFQREGDPLAYLRPASPEATVPAALQAIAWQHLWLGGETDVVGGAHWTLTGADVNDGDDRAMVLVNPGDKAECSLLDPGQVLDGAALVVVLSAPAPLATESLVGRHDGAVGWAVALEDDGSATLLVQDGTSSASASTPGVATGGLQVLAVGGEDAAMRLVGPGGSAVASVPSERRGAIVPLTVGQLLEDAAEMRVVLVGLAPGSAQDLRDAVTAALGL